MLSAILNPAGGLRYHWRAVRHRPRWQPFVQPLAVWLEEWRPSSPHLVLIGPSAGWCLPDALFRRFATLDVLEPDPVAWLLLDRRLRRIGRTARRHETNYLASTPDAFERLTRDFPAHAVLFCNVLGQLRFVHPALDDPTRLASWKAGLHAAFERREWATFHDRLSGSLVPRIAEPADASTTLATDAQLVAAFYDGDGELDSHGTEDLFPGHARRYFGWEISPGRHHLIEAIRHA